MFQELIKSFRFLRFSICHLERFATVSLPLAVELMLEDFSAALTRQASFFQAQLAHLHVVDASDEKDRWLISVKFHLPGNVLAVKMCVPPTTIVVVVGI